MIVRALKLGHGRTLKKEIYFKVWVNQGTEDEPNIVPIYLNEKTNPEILIGMEINCEMSAENFKKFPGEEKTYAVIEKATAVSF